MLPQPVQHVHQVAAELQALDIGSTFTFSLGYSGVASDTMEDHAGRATVSLRF